VLIQGDSYVTICWGISILDYRSFFVPYGRRISLYENRIGFLLFGLVI